MRTRHASLEEEMSSDSKDSEISEIQVGSNPRRDSQLGTFIRNDSSFGRQRELLWQLKFCRPKPATVLMRRASREIILSKGIQKKKKKNQT